MDGGVHAARYDVWRDMFVAGLLGKWPKGINKEPDGDGDTKYVCGEGDIKLK